MQQYQEYEEDPKPKNRIVSRISGLLATFFDRLLFVIIGIIIGAGTFIVISFIIK